MSSIMMSPSCSSPIDDLFFLVTDCNAFFFHFFFLFKTQQWLFVCFFFHYYIFSLRFLIRVWQHFILFFEFNCSLCFDDECSFLQLIVGSRINLSSNCKCQLFNHHRASFFYNFNLDEEFSNSIFISTWIEVVERPPLPRRLPTRSPDGWPPIAS